jgi:serine/threonine protein kinase
VNVLERYASHVTLEEVMRAYPRGLPFRDAVWMGKRLLAALGFVHRRGLVHGAVLPPHVLVHPVNHGARLVDWAYAAKDGERVRAMSAPWRAYYAPEIPARGAVSPATDIYMAVATIVALLGGDVGAKRLPREVPEPLARFFATCLAPSPARRPDDAWKLHEDLDELLRRLVGEPKYRPLKMPA